MLRSRGADRTAGWTVGVLAAVFGIFFLVPLGGLVLRAASDGRTWELMHSEAVRTALTLSLTTATLSTLLAVLFGTPVAYLLARGKGRRSAILDALVDLPLVLPPTVAGVALLTAFGRRGLLGEPLSEWFGLELTFTTAAVVLAQLIVAAPFYVRAVASGFASVDAQYERVAWTLGASRVEAFFRITVPQARPAMLAGIVLCWTRALGELGATLIFAGNLQGTTRTMPLAVLDALERSSLGLSGALSLSLILLGVALAVLIGVRLVAPGRRP